jgi:hypothetical protein
VPESDATCCAEGPRPRWLLTRSPALPGRPARHLAPPASAGVPWPACTACTGSSRCSCCSWGRWAAGSTRRTGGPRSSTWPTSTPNVRSMTLRQGCRPGSLATGERSQRSERSTPARPGGCPMPSSGRSSRQCPSVGTTRAWAAWRSSSVSTARTCRPSSLRTGPTVGRASQSSRRDPGRSTGRSATASRWGFRRGGTTP